MTATGTDVIRKASLFVAFVLYLATASFAQYDISGSCLDNPVTLPVSTTNPIVNGKPAYEGTGTFNGMPNTPLQIFWNSVDNVWIFGSGGAVIGFNNTSSPEPPVSSADAWTDFSNSFGLNCGAPTVAVTILPVELVGLSAKRVGLTVALDWQTASETNNVGFDVERSIDAETWITLGFVAGAGTTGASSTYAYTDASAPSSATYYRLRQRDLDGVTDLSDVVSVGEVRTGDFAFAIGPNPANGLVTVRGLIQATEIKIYDATGREVYRGTDIVDGQSLDLSALPAGRYVLQASSLRGTVGTLPFILH